MRFAPLNAIVSALFICMNWGVLQNGSEHSTLDFAAFEVECQVGRTKGRSRVGEMEGCETEGRLLARCQMDQGLKQTLQYYSPDD